MTEDNIDTIVRKNRKKITWGITLELACEGKGINGMKEIIAQLKEEKRFHIEDINRTLEASNTCL